MTSAFGLISLARAQQMAAQFLNLPETAWMAVPGSRYQEFWAARLFQILPSLSGFSADELKAWASRNAEEINRLIAAEGFGIRLDPWNDPEAFGVASVFRWAIQWLVVGQTELYGEPFLIKGKPAFRLNRRPNGIEFRKFGDDLLVNVSTQTGHVAHFVKYGRPVAGIEILETIAEVEGNAKPMQYGSPDGVDIPKSQIDVQPDLSWLLGMRLGGYFVAQAKQQVRLAINEFGAAGEEVSAMAMRKGLPEYYKIDGPYLFWVSKGDLTIAAAHVGEESWQEPAGKLAETIARPRSVRGD